MENLLTVPSDAVLLIVDVQRDFCPGGALGVAEGDHVVPVINGIEGLFQGRVVTSQDLHPANHVSFKDNGGIWPAHCVQNSEGAKLHPDLLSANITVLKGTDPSAEAYSAFGGRMARNSSYPPSEVGLKDYLNQREIKTVFVTGIATDYCVKATALDAVANGYTTYVVFDACRGVAPESTEAAIAEMQAAGVQFVLSGDLTK